MLPRTTWLAVAALSALVSAQTTPVPTRIVTEIYGVTAPTTGYAAMMSRYNQRPVLNTSVFSGNCN